MSRSIKQVLERKGSTFHWVIPEESVFSALAIMARFNTGCVLVMQADHLVGIFTERDYARKVVLKGLASREAAVGDLMTANPVTVDLDATVDEVMAIMTERRFRHMPVVHEGRVVGIVTIGDMVKAIVTEQQETIDQLESYIAGDFNNP